MGVPVSLFDYSVLPPGVLCRRKDWKISSPSFGASGSLASRSGKPRSKLGKSSLSFSLPPRPSAWGTKARESVIHLLRDLPESTDKGRDYYERGRENWRRLGYFYFSLPHSLSVFEVFGYLSFHPRLKVGFSCRQDMEVGNMGQGSELVQRGEDDLESSSRRELIEAIWEENQGPYEGMEFESREAARVFYNEYARRVGFGTRTGSLRYSRRDNEITSQRFVCAKEGFHRKNKKAGAGGTAPRQRAITRMGCQAMIVVKKTDSGKWVVRKVEKHHNHPLVTQEKVRYLRSHRHSSGTMRSSNKLYMDPVNSAVAMFAPRVESCATSSVRFVEQDCRNYLRIGRQRIIGSDAQNVLNYFKHLRAENPAFYYSLQVDEDQCVSNVFWADAKARMAYSYFGDVVTFDITHKTSQLPLVQFSGLNHHGQPVLFGCALLLNESESSLVWLFRTWLEAMSGRHPISLTTVPDMTVKTAVAKVFPVTRHRIFKSSIFRDCQEKLSYIYYVYPTFEDELHKCIYTTETINEFELSWRSLLDSYNLRDNEWLQALYWARHEWVTAYLRDTFFGEIPSLDGSENRKSFFDGYMNGDTTLQNFIQQYEKALECRYEEEAQADFDTMQTSPTLKTPSPMEKQAADLYTRKVFASFQEELVETFVYTAHKILDNEANSKYKVIKFEEEHKEYVVTFNALEKRANCSCQMFEFSGILCRHVLTVFRVVNVLTLPHRYILKRWTKNAKTVDVLDDYSVELQGNSRESLTLRYNNLRHQAIKYVEEGANSLDIYDVAMAALREAADKVSAAKKNIMRVAPLDMSVGGSNKNGKVNDGSHADYMTETSC